jgi:mannitol operon transcriptional antiterminator
VSIPLDTRVIRITRWLLSQTEPRSTSHLAHDLGLSERVVRYRLGAAESFLRSHGAELKRQRGSGLSVDATPEVQEAILEDLADRALAPRVYAPEEREHLLLDLLLWSWPNTISLDRLNDDLEVSKTSARRDLRRCEPWLDRMGLPVVRRPGKGIALHGSEQRIRRALVQLLLEAVPNDVLSELVTTDFDDAELVRVRIPAGLRDRFAALSIRECAQALAESSLTDRLATGNSDLVFTIYLAITEARFADGSTLELVPGQLRSLRDHPVFDSVRALSDSLVEQGGQRLPDEEIAALTEYLLGLDALADVPDEAPDHGGLLDGILTEASDNLHVSLGADEELRRSLAMHLSRLQVRLRYGLPVHNPLLAEVIERYPDVHVVSKRVSDLIEEAFGTELPQDEVGFITMYLSGAMERAHLRPRKQALVVCPSGMATAWVLVSRLQAEFPHLALAEVLSAPKYEERDTSGFDVVISTIPLEQDVAPVVVVSPLLSQADVRTLSTHV